jgi:methionyl-tRNA formyltransferase
MRIVLLCATQRGYRFLQKLTALLAPATDLVVFSFPEEPREPPFLNDIRGLTLAKEGQFFEAKQVGAERWNHFWETTEVDLMLAVSWRYMIPPLVYRRARLGTFVFHDSPLPQYRGFSPTVWAMINGENHTGVTLFEIAEGVDEGPIVDQERVSIGPDDTISLVLERVTKTYLALLERNLEELVKGTARRIHQDHSQATYTCKRLPEDNQIDWTASTRDIYNLIRAVSAPYPGAYTYLSGKQMRVWSAKRVHDNRPYIGRIPGRVVEVRHGEGTVVLTGDGVLMLCQVQIEGSEITCASEVIMSPSQTLRYHPLAIRNEN